MRDPNPAEARHLGADAMPPHHSHRGVCAWCDYEGRVFPELLGGCSYDCWAELYQAAARRRRVESETDPGTLTDPDTYHEEKNR